MQLLWIRGIFYYNVANFDPTLSLSTMKFKIQIQDQDSVCNPIPLPFFFLGQKYMGRLKKTCKSLLFYQTPTYPPLLRFGQCYEKFVDAFFFNLIYSKPFETGFRLITKFQTPLKEKEFNT